MVFVSCFWFANIFEDFYAYNPEGYCSVFCVHVVSLLLVTGCNTGLKK